jgi:predicted transcriptional regulator
LYDDVLSGEKVNSVMIKDPVAVSPDITVDNLVENYIYKYHHKMFPVVENEILRGCVSTSDIKNLNRDEWKMKRVREVAKECSIKNSIGSEAELVEALSRMNSEGAGRLLVTDGEGKLAGIISYRDIMKELTLRMELKS